VEIATRTGDNRWDVLEERIEFRILGPLVVRVGGEAVALGGPKQRGVLAMLLLNANRVVSRDRLISELLADQSIGSADHALRNHVSRLRKALAPAALDEPRLVARAPGYLLRVEPEELDFEQFETLVSEGRELLATGDPMAASTAFLTAEALWSGRPLADLETEPFARVEVERLEESRLAAVEARIDADLLLGRHSALVPELEVLAAEQPFRERFRAQLMLALYRCGRQADGLSVYRETSLRMRDELGLEPSVELQQLERAILVQDPALQIAVSGNGRAVEPMREVCPYKGLARFDAADAEYFFGRERLVDELVARFADMPLLAIVGASGSGKSSLLRAGLLPALHTETLVVRPSEVSAPHLAERLAGGRVGKRLVVAVDQFEEVFAASVPEEERRAFIATLADATWDPERRSRIVLAVRADFFERLAPYGELAELVGANQVLLGPMSRGDLRRAIEGPAARAGLDVEPALTDALVEEAAGEAGALPLLSTTLVDLWQERDQGSLTLSAYQRMGGVHGAVGRRAEAAFEALSQEERSAARRLLLHLVAGGESDVLTRRRVSAEELNPDNDPIIAQIVAKLISSRLLVADGGSVELVHEALLEHWARLADWLEEDAEGNRLHRRLAQAAAEWQAGGRDTGELYHAARLAATLEWAEAAGAGAGLTEVEEAFLRDSRAASTRAARRLRTVLALVVGLLLLALAAAVVAWQQRNDARQQRNDARQQATVAQAQRLDAQALIQPNLDLSLLLAREAVNLDDSTATRSGLLAALLRNPAAIRVGREGSQQLLDEALSPDGRTLAVRGDDGNIALLNTQTLRPAGPRIAGSNQTGMVGAVRGPYHALAFSPNDQTLAVGGSDGTTATIELLATRTTHVVEILSDRSGFTTTDVAYAPDGRTFATAVAVNGTSQPPPEVIESRNAQTGHVLARAREIAGARLAGYTHDGRFLLVVTARTARLLDSRTLKTVKTFAVGGFAALSPSADQAAIGHANGTVTLLDLASGQQYTLARRASGAIQAITYSHDGTMLATAAGRTVSVWDVHTGVIRETFSGHSAAVRSIAFSPHGQTLYTAADDGSVIKWDVSGTRSLDKPFRYSRTAVQSPAVAVSPDGSLFAVSPAPDRVALWHGDPPTPKARVLRGPSGGVYAIAFSPGGTLVAATGTRHTVVWSTRNGTTIRVLPAFGEPALAFSPTGDTLAIGGGDGADYFYNTHTWKPFTALDAGGSTQDISFSPNGKLLASASLTGVVTIWDIAKNGAIATLPGAILPAAVRFSPDGKLVAVGDSSGGVVLWNVATGRRVGAPLIVPGGVSSLDFNRHGQLITAGGDGQLRLWDVATRILIGAPMPAAGTNSQTRFFPTGNQVLDVSSSGTGVIWNVNPTTWEAQACQVANRNLTRQEWNEYISDRSYAQVCP
jgi:WD40 repeat protein/DNA-binding SARP family transcriptional activator